MRKNNGRISESLKAKEEDLKARSITSVITTCLDISLVVMCVFGFRRKLKR